MDTRLRSNAAASPFSSQPTGLRVFWLAALSLIGRRPQRVFSLFASRIQPKYAAAPLNQSRTWCTSVPSHIYHIVGRHGLPSLPKGSYWRQQLPRHIVFAKFIFLFFFGPT